MGCVHCNGDGAHQQLLELCKKTKAEYSLFNKQFSDSYSYIGIDYFKLSILFTPLSD